MKTLLEGWLHFVHEAFSVKSFIKVALGGVKSSDQRPMIVDI